MQKQILFVDLNKSYYNLLNFEILNKNWNKK